MQREMAVGSLPPVPGGTPSEPGDIIGDGGVPFGVAPTVSPPLSAIDKTVELTFIADRNQLFNTAWNAIANLADLAGKVTVTVHAESEKGFDKSKLQTASWSRCERRI